MKKIILVFAVLLVITACSKSQVRPYQGKSFLETNSTEVEILNSFPDRQHVKIGAVSVREYKPGFGEPTVSDAHERLQNAGSELGAHAVVIVNSNSTEQRAIIVEGEGIRYTED